MMAEKKDGGNSRIEEDRKCKILGSTMCYNDCPLVFYSNVSCVKKKGAKCKECDHSKTGIGDNQPPLAGRVGEGTCVAV
jgi:hypothetical protein